MILRLLYFTISWNQKDYLNQSEIQDPGSNFHSVPTSPNDTISDLKKRDKSLYLGAKLYWLTVPHKIDSRQVS